MTRRWKIRCAALVVAAMASIAMAVTEGGRAPSVASALTPPCTLCGGGEYHPLTPTRIFDSRPATAINDVAPFGDKPTGNARPPATFAVKIVGEVGDPIAASVPTDTITTDDVLAVMVNVAIVGPTKAGYLTAYPAGTSPATPSAILNFTANQTVSNLAVVRPGTDGNLTIFIYTGTAGTAHLVIDVFGWFSTSGYDAGTPYDDTDDATSAESQADERGSRLIPVSPGRLLDTRPAKGGAGPLGAGATRELQIRGADTVVAPVQTDIVPLLGAVTGVLLNVTAVGPSRPTYISVLPDSPVGPPSTANINVSAGGLRGNLVAVPVGADGKIRFYNHSGSVDIVADVMGYFLADEPEATRSGRVVPLTSPFRAFDTRGVAFGSVPLGPAQAEVWSFADFAASVNVGGTAVGEQLGLIGNLTSASLTRQYPTVAVSSYLTAYPADAAARPVISNLNNVEGAPIPNMTILVYATAAGKEQQVAVFNYRGYTHYVLDVSAVILADPPTA